MGQGVRIEPVADHELYTINGKEIYKDSNGNYIAKEQLDQEELMAFRNYKKSVIDNEAFKRHTKATYGKK